MKMRRAILTLLILILLVSFIGTIYASDNSNETITDENMAIDGEYLSMSSPENEDIISDNPSSGKTITIVADKSNPNQVLNPTVQPAIDNASDGDTIVLKGNFVHCHFTIDKTLNVVTHSGTTLGPCPHHKHEGLDEFGVFYITENGSGSVIDGFTFLNNDRSETPFGVLVSGASNVTIKDCTMSYPDHGIDKYTGIIIENSNNVNLSNLKIDNTIYGIRIINSVNVTINNCILSNNENYAVSVSGESENINIINNTIINNGKSGINLSSINNVIIRNNYLENNGQNDVDSGSGVYVNSNITKLIVKGNIFLKNGLHAIMYDYRTRNLNNDTGADLLTTVDNNYFSGHSSMILHHRTYIEYPNGNMNYDAENDIFYNSENGKFIESKSFVYMQRAFVEADIICGFTYYTTDIPWTMESTGNDGKYDLSLVLSNMTQVKKGVYQVSIIDKNGEIASDLSSFNVKFYLNNINKVDSPDAIVKEVKIKNGTATADFTDMKDQFLESGNVIAASFPGITNYVEENPNVKFDVKDSNIPGVLTESKITPNAMNFIYGASQVIGAKLTDNENNALANKTITVSIKSNSYEAVSDDNGEIRLPVNLAIGSYDVIFSFKGDDENNKTSATGKIVISKATPKLSLSTLTTFPLSDEYFKVKLTDSNGKALSSQKITFKINGKTYSAKTDSKGIAKVKVSLTPKESYSIGIKFAGNNLFKSISKTGKIVVKTGSKKSKITASNIKVKKNTKKTYSIKLTSSAGKAISKQKITVKLNGKTYTVKTNAKGIAKLTIKLSKVKKYKATLKFLGNKSFKGFTKTTTITVK